MDITEQEIFADGDTVVINRLSTALPVVRPVDSLTRFVQPNERLADLLRIRTTEDIRASLAYRGVPKDPELWAADASAKKDAMGDYAQSYMPSDAAVTFTEDFLSKYRRTFRARDFHDEDYREFYNETREVLHGQSLRPLPPSLNALAGASFTLVGPSGMGRTAYLRRLRKMLGKHFTLYGVGKEPAMMHVVPQVSLQYPECGTLKGFFVDLRFALSAALGVKDTSRALFPELVGDDAQNFAISLCILLNVGALIIDSACWASMAGEPERIVSFLVRFQEYSGIPVIVSGSCAFMYTMGLLGSKSSNLLNGRSLSLDAAARPTAVKDSESTGVDPWSGAWHKKNVWLWHGGPLAPDHLMPADLSVWTYGLCWGRDNWLVQFFEELHFELIADPKLLKPGALSQEVVAEIARRRLILQTPARRVVREYMETEGIKDETDFFDHIDHLPLWLLNKPKFRKLMTGTRA